ncbi:motility protein A [Tissierella praeacuta]|uniref:Chemotaxis protein MotA n=1 Tax=Tissierella praeacuta DSM 18095 TaxID=1123404 RepID=A0A1M4SLB7_9FIRM|nr:MotA/TolQ/ExbB proton channel family protein [Tissierella praeacuta]MBU5254761.1 MotA/TolQ/ExbB proton channel family protein [Tissierella praeacuta]TCU70583.1 chemotaxis protein MotA [Tissierella praeacuta]SHE33006.1 chemotaxis protein MotA [Tissierella praeacuta DSM 18095]SUP01541.1 Chemotaxis protein MotA [Tissierella praeacuta]
MDIATILGLFLGIGFTIWGILQSGSLSDYWDFPSVIIVLGGTVAATFLAYPLKEISKIGKVLQKAFTHKSTSPNEIIENIINLANVARKEGLLSLEEYASKLEDDFLKKGIMLIVDGTDPDLVRNILETELMFLEERHGQGQGTLEAMGAFAPAFGMLGTLIGLINMLQKMDDPKAIGPNMSVALITTFYGSALANIIFLPLAQKLKVRSKSEVLVKELMIEGLLSIQAGENPRIIEEKLKTFIPPEMRVSIKKEFGKEEA